MSNIRVLFAQHLSISQKFVIKRYVEFLSRWCMFPLCLLRVSKDHSLTSKCNTVASHLHLHRRQRTNGNTLVQLMLETATGNRVMKSSLTNSEEEAYLTSSRMRESGRATKTKDDSFSASFFSFRQNHRQQLLPLPT